jgi:hypothetical protein
MIHLLTCQTKKGAIEILNALQEEFGPGFHIKVVPTNTGDEYAIKMQHPTVGEHEENFIVRTQSFAMGYLIAMRQRT